MTGATFKRSEAQLVGAGWGAQNTHKLHPDFVGIPLEGGTPGSYLAPPVQR